MAMITLLDLHVGLPKFAKTLRPLHEYVTVEKFT